MFIRFDRIQESDRRTGETDVQPVLTDTKPHHRPHCAQHPAAKIESIQFLRLVRAKKNGVNGPKIRSAGAGAELELKRGERNIILMRIGYFVVNQWSGVDWVGRLRLLMKTA